MTPAYTTKSYCQRIKCQGSAGVNVHFTGDTWESPGWFEPEECPYCGGILKDEHVPYEDAIAGLLDELQVTGVLPLDQVVDEPALFAVIQDELERQRRAAWRAQYGLPDDPLSAEYEARMNELLFSGVLPF